MEANVSHCRSRDILSAVIGPVEVGFVDVSVPNPPPLAVLPFLLVFFLACSGSVGEN